MSSFMKFGPFELPKKSRWLIVGSGPSARLRQKFDGGIIALNNVIEYIDRCDVHICNHYEVYIQTFEHLHKSEYLFMANPMNVGYKCVWIDSSNLVDLRWLGSVFKDKARFYKREETLKAALDNHNGLYIHHTISTAALHLLYKNGIKDVYYCGIDGGIEHEVGSKYVRYSKCFPNYDEGYKDFIKTAKKLGIKLYDLKTTIIDYKNDRALYARSHGW